MGFYGFFGFFWGFLGFGKGSRGLIPQNGIPAPGERRSQAIRALPRARRNSLEENGGWFFFNDFPGAVARFLGFNPSAISPERREKRSGGHNHGETSVMFRETRFLFSRRFARALALGLISAPLAATEAPEEAPNVNGARVAFVSFAAED
jgi:hypothetical protein